MPRILYNEGRVVGYSAYEIYVKNHKAVDPDATPASEREWLASSLAMGSSLLLRVGSDSTSGAHYRDITFPEGSNLSAANVIFASCFIGAGDVGSATSSDNVWCTKVVDYGNLISNTSELSPSGTTVPTKQDISIDDNTKNQFLSYANIIDGIVLQPGTWVENTSKPPEKSLQPTLSELPILRLSFSDTVATPFFLLLTGFTNKGVLVGETSVAQAGASSSPQDGDFLGPAVFPWSAKVIFSIPPYAMSIISGSVADFTYSRYLGDEALIPKSVNSAPIIDFTSYNPAESGRYDNLYQDSKVRVNVQAIDVTAKENAAVLTSYSPSYDLNSEEKFFYPSLYGSIISDVGDTYIYPFDSYAPGTLHLYQDCSDYIAEDHSRNLELSLSGARAFTRDTNTLVVNEYDKSSDIFVPVAKTFRSSLFGTLSSEPVISPMFYVQGSFRSGLHQKWNGSDYPVHTGGIEIDPAIITDESLWYIEIDDDIVNEYTLESIEIITGPNPDDREIVQGISGTTAMQDRLMFCAVGCLMHRRLTGKFSDKVKSVCGYENIFDNQGNPIGPFGSGGIWDATESGNSNRMSLFTGQIPDDAKHDYYSIYAIPVIDGFAGNVPLYPVKSDDNYIDVTYKYRFNIIVNGNAWNIPHFESESKMASGFRRGSKYLGTWWNSVNSGDHDDKMHGTYCLNGWMYIDEPDILHPTAYSAVVDKFSGFVPGSVYQYKSMLPIPEIYTKTMQWLFGETLDDSGIMYSYRDMTVLEFLQTALYTDMGTGQPLRTDSSHSVERNNVLMGTNIYSNGYDEQTQTYDRDDMEVTITLKMHNSSETVSTTQFMEMPDIYMDDNANDPMAVITETGKLQSFALSMSDKNNSPYNLYGTSGILDVRDVGQITWYSMLRGLAENKSVNVIGEVLSGLAVNISGSGKNYIEFSDSSDHPIRIYVSASEPAVQIGDTIPEGSVGLGWGTGVHTYTSGAWSS